MQITSTIEGHNLTAGTNFSLICTVDGTAKLRPKLSFQWIYFNGTDVKETGTNSSRLHFSSLKLSEAGEYMCQVNIRSSLLKSDLNMISMLPYPVRVFGKLMIGSFFYFDILPYQHSTPPQRVYHSTISSCLCWVISQCHLCCSV